MTLPSLSRPDLPQGPYWVAGLARAGQAAIAALERVAGPSRVCAWDGLSFGRVRRTAARLRLRGDSVALGSPPEARWDADPPGCLVKSPGIDDLAPLIAIWGDTEPEIIDELELGWRLSPHPVIGITGTNGKTTTTRLASAILAAAGIPAETVGNTLYGPPLSAAADAPYRWLICEVSSYQLEHCPRLLPEVAVFTNLTRDHLHRHRTIADYAACKRRLFVRGRAAVPCAIVNTDDPFGRQLEVEVRAHGGRVVSYGSLRGATYRVLDCDWTPRSGTVLLSTPAGRMSVPNRVPGPHNALNVAAAIALAGALGVPAEVVAEALRDAPPPPGRFEPIDEGQPFDLIVDYAHTPDGIEKALITARRIVAGRSGRLRVVLGIVGGHDPVEHRSAGRIAGDLCDHMIVTPTNLRGEPPLPILQSLLRGARDSSVAQLDVYLDRAEGIAAASAAAQGGDLMLVLGRGALPGQAVDRSGAWHRFDDRDVARSTLQELAA